MSSTSVTFTSSVASSSEATAGGSSGNVMGISAVGDSVTIHSDGSRTYYWHINYRCSSSATGKLSWGGTCSGSSGSINQSAKISAGSSNSWTYYIWYEGYSGTYYEAKVIVYVNNPATHTYTFSANGGTAGSVTTKKKIVGINMTFPTESESPTRLGYINLGWSDSSSATTAKYEFGKSYGGLSESNLVFYAVWKLDYRQPTINSINTQRCNKNTLLPSDEGTAIRVFGSFQLDTYQLDAVGVSYMTIIYRKPNDATGIQTIILNSTSTPALSDAISYNASTRSGAFDYYIGAASHTSEQDCSGDFAWEITVTITDTRNASLFLNHSGSATVIELAAFSILDVGKKGKNITFGATANDDIDIGQRSGIVAFASTPVLQLNANDTDLKNSIDQSYFIDGSGKTFLDLKQFLGDYRKLLWENPNPYTTSFSNGEISVSGISKFGSLIFMCAANTSFYHPVLTEIPVIPNTDMTIVGRYQATGSSYNSWISERNISIDIANEKIAFSGGYYYYIGQASKGAGNTFCIPLKIWGVPKKIV